MTFLLVALGAGAAVAVELVEALAIVLAVAVTTRLADALIGAAGAVLACAAIAVVLGPVVLESVSLDVLRLVIGALLLVFGLQWLRKGTLRLGGRRPRSSVEAEYAEATEQVRAAGETDWAGRVVAFKGVFLEGIEVVIIVTALAARPSGPAPALVGAGGATAVVLTAGAWLRRPLARLPETELKWGVGVLLSAFGVFFAAEGLGLHWPGGDAAVLYLVAAFAGVSQALIRSLRRGGRSPDRDRRTPARPG